MFDYSEYITWYDTGNKDYGFGGPGWYFWDETSAYMMGPYTSKELARQGMKEYGEWLNKDLGVVRNEQT
jgi:hypothetical protein